MTAWHKTILAAKRPLRVKLRRYDFARQVFAGRGRRICDDRPVVSRFAYLRDRLFWLGVALYALNRWWLKPHFHTAFLRGYFNDLWLIACALPPLLWLHRRLGLRGHDLPPTFAEITFHFVVWSAVCEGIAPHWIKRATGDWWDVAAYGVGALIAGLWWNRKLLRNRWHEL